MRKKVKVIIDRPKGYIDSYGNKYPLNYGYVPGIIAGDGEEQDAYVLGIYDPIEEFTGEVIAIIHRKNDVEDKWVVSNKKNISKKEIEEATYFLEKYFDSEIEMIV